MNWRQNTGYRDGSFQRCEACVFDALFEKRLKQSRCKICPKLQITEHCSSFLPWFVSAFVLRSLGRLQKKRRTERYCVNLENCRTKGFITERSMCLDIEQRGPEKSKVKHFIIGNYCCALEMKR